MFGNTKLINTTDADGVVWAQKQQTIKVKPTKAELSADPDARPVLVTTNVGTRFKVLDPNYDPNILLPESDSLTMQTLRETYAARLVGNPDQAAINVANLVIGATGLLMLAAFIYLLLAGVAG